MSLYSWEQKLASSYQSYGNRTLSILLLLSALVIILIALFSRNVIFKSLVLAYVILP